MLAGAPAPCARRLLANSEENCPLSSTGLPPHAETATAKPAITRTIRMSDPIDRVRRSLTIVPSIARSRLPPACENADQTDAHEGRGRERRRLILAFIAILRGSSRPDGCHPPDRPQRVAIGMKPHTQRA